MWNVIPYTETQMKPKVSSVQLWTSVTLCECPGKYSILKKAIQLVQAMGALTLLGVPHWTKTWTANSTSSFGHSNFRQSSSLSLAKNILRSTIWCQVNIWVANAISLERAAFGLDFHVFSDTYLTLLTLASSQLVFGLCFFVCLWGFSFLFCLFVFVWFSVSYSHKTEYCEVLTVPANTLSSPVGLLETPALSLHLCDLPWSQDTGLFLGTTPSIKMMNFIPCCYEQLSRIKEHYYFSLSRASKASKRVQNFQLLRKDEIQFTFMLRKGFVGQLYQAVCLPPRGRASWRAAAWVGRLSLFLFLEPFSHSNLFLIYPCFPLLLEQPWAHSVV